MGIIIVLIVITMGVVVVVIVRPNLANIKGGGIIILLALFVLPGLVYIYGAMTHLERSKQTDFCLSCHAMEPYGVSLKIDDPTYIPAVHWQNNLIPSDNACYTCHTTYTMFGGIKVKLQGLKHFYIQYFDKPPEEIHLYEPFQNRECFHCHEDSRSFVEFPVHKAILEDLQSNDLSCTECHRGFHDIADLANKTLWERSEN